MSASLTIRAMTVAACLVAVGCDTKTADRAVPSQETRRPTAGSTPVRIVATDSGFEAPPVVAAGLRHFVFENRGTRIHEAMLIKLADGMSADDYANAVKGGADFPAGALDYSGPGLTSPGESVEIWTRVDPGRYILVCWNNHFRTTRLHSFTVQGDGEDDQPPKADVVLKLVNYRFELEGELRAGVRVLRVETPGPAMHEVDLFRLHDGKTAADVIQWRKRDDDRGPAPAQALGGVLDSHDLSRVVWLRRSFDPGRYVLHCQMPVTMGGSGAEAERTHADVGMVQELEIRE